MTFIAILGRVSAFTDVSFMRPCWLPEPGSNEKCVLRCTRRGEGPFEIASWRGKRTSMEYEFKTHFRATLKVAFTASSKQIPNRTHVSWNVTNKLGTQNMNTPGTMAGVYSCGKASAMRMPMGRTAWFLSARKFLCNPSRQSARYLNTGQVASVKRTLSLPARRQWYKPLRGSILSSRLRVLASRAWNNKCGYSYEASALQVSQVYTSSASFQGPLLVAVGPSKPLSAGRIKQPTPSRPQENLQLKQLAAAKAGTRSQKALLDELTAIAAEVTGTTITADAPLMDSGLDSIGATELSNKISAHLKTELSPTLLFDHPSLRSIADALSVDQEIEEVVKPEVESPEPGADLELAQRP